MASTRQLKTRIRSVKGTRQITKAMELVAASKMRKSADAAASVQTFSQAARELLTYLNSLPDAAGHPLYEERKIENRLLIVVSSDKGLAGAYNSNVLKGYTAELNKDATAGIDSKTICIGKKAIQFASRIKGADIIGSYQDMGDKPRDNELRAIVNTAVQCFLDGDVDAVDVVYTRYINSITQEAITQRLLPAGFESTEDVSESFRQASFEPSAEEVLERTTLRLIEAQLYQALLDATASEHSMRMVAMKNASDNAGDIIDDLTLEMNKVRQAAITQELSEISGGVEALK